MGQKTFIYQGRRAFAGYITALLYLIIFSSVSIARADIGLNWLATQSQDDGSYALSNDTATAYQSTSETLRTFKLLDQSSSIYQNAALQFLDSETYLNSEYLARKIIAKIDAGYNVSGLVTELKNYADIRGGFGELTGYHVTVLDTAIALEALNYTDNADNTIAAAAINVLLIRQDDNGSWHDGNNVSSIYLTSLAARALLPFKDKFTGVAESLSAARNFLLSRRDASGAWPSEMESAHALLTLATLVSDNSTIRASADALSAKQNADGSWSGDVYTTAIAIRALYVASQPIIDPDLGGINGHVIDGDSNLPLSGVTVNLIGTTAMSSVTAQDGSFDFSGLEAGAYTVELTYTDYFGLTVNTNLPVGEHIDLGILTLVKGNAPTTGSIRGIVTDVDTGTPLSNVIISANNLITQTAADGSYQISGVIPALYTLSANLDGYTTTTASAEVTAGNIVVFSPALAANDSSSAHAVLFGTITDAKTGLPLTNVDIQITGATTTQSQTDTQGRYRIESLNPGDIQIATNLNGYNQVNAQITIINNEQIEFSPALYPGQITSPPGTSTHAAIFGTITDADTGFPLTNVNILITGATTAQIQTDSEGQYRIEPLNPGDTKIEAHLSGYNPINAQVKINDTEQIDFSPALYPSQITSEPGISSITGVVLDSTTDQPLAGVLVQADFNQTTETFITDGNGIFNINDVETSEIDLSFTNEGYVTSTFKISLDQSGERDIGQIRLRPEEASILLPDLVIENVNSAAVETDLNSLQISGNLNLMIANRGNRGNDRDFEILAYYDENRNHRYDELVDILLGKQLNEGLLAVDGQQELSLPLAGKVPFRDAPIDIWIDSTEIIAEPDETNNSSTTSSDCRIDPLPSDALDPVEKWHWSSSPISPSYNQVMSTPMVAQLNDDNGDNKIDFNDTPDIVFTTFRGSSYTGIGLLRAISGSDGTDIWNVAPQANAMIAPAIGDIDNDGLVEIVVGGPNRSGLRVYENDGTLKWNIAVSGYAHPAIADVDNDGTPEIIYGRRIYNPDGELLREFPVGASIPVIADLDMDGDLEIISSGTAYQHDGTTLWTSGFLGGIGAIGNFDDDDFPEIAIRTIGSVTLLEHDGTLKWGPVSIPGGGGGPLTIADVDGDGEPEIGVAGASNYTVFETDGSIKWTSPTRDFSSRATGSSVFDFESDGRAEILYNDELKFRIYDGESGTILFEIQNTSGTILENPVVADIDNDGHAEVVLASNNYAFGGKTGIRVFENRDDLWAATRSIWNQHSYHINNVNDDGTIPQFEEPSWLSHNSYRLNTFIARDPLSSPDLTASQLLISDNGYDQFFDLSVRIGNAGIQTTPDTVKVTFYQGLPDAGGIQLGSTSLPVLASGEYTDIRLEGVILSNSDPVYAIVDSLNEIRECNETNNTAHAPLSSIVALGEITVGTDAPFYDAKTPVELSVEVVNNSSFTQGYQVEFILKDLEGTTVATFTPQQTGLLDSHSTKTVKQNWNTASTLAGNYQIYGRLLDTNGHLLDEAVAPFTIERPDSALDSTVITDKPLYQAWDQVNITGRVENTTSNAIQAPSFVEITVRHPSGAVLFSDTAQAGELLPGALRNLPFVFTLVDVQSGTYAVEMLIKDAFSHQIISTASTHFQVERQALQALTGQVKATPVQVNKGDPVQCTETVNNIAATALGNIQLNSQLVSIDYGQVIRETERTITLDGGQSATDTRTLATDGLAIGAYACVLTATIAGQSQDLGAAGFDVLEPPIRIDSELSQGFPGRLLILLDDGDKDNDDEDDDDESDCGSNEDDEDDDEDNDPYGTSHAPTLTEQQAYLETLLTDHQWSYTIVTEKEAFTREFRTGTYTVYALFSEQKKLAEQAQQELREAVFRGDGLLVAGDHDHRHNKLDSTVGLEFEGKLSDVEGIDLLSTTFPLSGISHWMVTEKPLKVISEGAEVIAYYLGTHEKVAVTRHRYGEGRSLFAGFDLLAQASQTDADPQFGELILEGLMDIVPDTAETQSGAPASVRLKLTNKGIATAGQAIITLPENTTIIDSGAAQPQTHNRLLWPFDLVEEATEILSFWLQLPQQVDRIDMTSDIYVGTAPELTEYTTLHLSLSVDPVPTLQDVLDLPEIQATAYKKIRKDIEKAQHALEKGDDGKALKYAIKATNRFDKISDPNANSIRLQLDKAIRAIAQQL